MNHSTQNSGRRILSNNYFVGMDTYQLYFYASHEEWAENKAQNKCIVQTYMFMCAHARCKKM